MSSALQHFLNTAASLSRVTFCIFILYKLWPRRKDWAQGFKKLTPEGIPVEQTPTYFDFRTRLVLCAFVSVALFFVLFTVLRRAFLPPAKPSAVAVEPAQTPPPRVPRSSTARAGDVVKIVCGGHLCALTETAQDASNMDAGRVPTGKVDYVANGTKAIVTAYDPQATGLDTAEVTILAGTDAVSITLTARSEPQKQCCIPGRWMHKLPIKEPMMVYQLQGK